MTQRPPTLAEADPKGLIRESYRIDGIGPCECRSIFVDWAMGLGHGIDPRAAMRVLLDEHDRPGHPMSTLLRSGLDGPDGLSIRRGGARGRR
ncbi:MAG: hypothetical protein ACXIU8_07350 [Alkalilacustris sp.]